MKRTRIHPTCCIGALLLFAAACVLTVPGARAGRNPREHKIHSKTRPHPPMVEAEPCTVEPPSDAVVLFDGEDLSEWQTGDGSEPDWKVEDGNMVIEPGTGDILTRSRFGDCQLHIEWATQDPLSDRAYPGNSGVYFGPYEIQILANHSEEPKIYADGMAGAIYGQYPPLVNACRKPGEWQSFDIIFRRPRFDDEGKLKQPATMTVFHNGVLVQDSEPLTGPTGHGRRPDYKPHGKVRIRLQDHKCVLRFRNIWVCPLDENKR